MDCQKNQATIFDKRGAAGIEGIMYEHIKGQNPLLDSRKILNISTNGRYPHYYSKLGRAVRLERKQPK